MIFIGIIVVPIDYLVDDNPDATVIIQGLGQSICALVLTVTLFGLLPYLYA